MSIDFISKLAPLGAFPIVDTNDALGGSVQVADDAARDAIPAARRRHGMLAFVQSSGISYRLGADLTTWTAESAGAGGDALTTESLAQFAATTSAELAGVISDKTGSGKLVFADAPVLSTPTLGAATATSVNKVAVTAPANAATLTIADGATLSATANASVSGTNTGDQTITLSGDVTGSGTAGVAATIANNSVTNAKAAQMPAHTLKGNNTAATANAADLTAAQVTAELNAMVGDTGTGGTKGLVPAPAAGDAAAAKFLKADGSWAVPAGGGGVSATVPPLAQILSAQALGGL